MTDAMRLCPVYTYAHVNTPTHGISLVLVAYVYMYDDVLILQILTHMSTNNAACKDEY